MAPMPDPSKKTTAKPQMPEKVSLRRGGKVTLNYSTRLLFQAIKNGKMLATDEYSLDGRHWAQLGRHKQLAKYLKKAPSSDQETFTENGGAQGPPPPGSPPPGLDDDLQRLADLLEGINSGA